MNKKQSLVWTFSKPDSPTKCGILLGTIHISNNFTQKLINSLAQNLATCDCLLLETDLDDMQRTSGDNYYHLDDNQLLTDFMAPKQYEKLRKSLLKKFSFDLQNYLKFNPLVIKMLISSQTLSNFVNLTPMDLEIWNMVDPNKRFGIDDIDTHLNTMSKIEIKSQIKQLMKIGQAKSSLHKKLRHYINLYKNQEISKIVKNTKGNSKIEFLYKRNIRMFDKIVQQHCNFDKIFMAVGAAHLYGNFGLIALLKRQGYIVNPMYQNL